MFKSFAHVREQHPPSVLSEQLSYEHFASAAQSAFAKHASRCALHSFVYAPDASLVHSLQIVYMPFPLDELAEELELPPPELLDDELDDIPDEDEDEPELPDELDAPLELDELLVVAVPVSSEHAPSVMSAHVAPNTPHTPR